MTEYKKFLTPIKPSPPPPEHTQIKPRCFTCSKWDVCSIRTDYLKTAKLIQNILGSPCDSYEISSLPFTIPDFCGTTIENWKDYFPETIITKKDKIGSFYMAKYQYSKCCCKDNYIKFIYIVDKFYVLFTAIYNEKTNQFNISAGKDIYYGITCEIAKDLEILQLGLLKLKEDIEQMENKDKDIINTSAFSAQLNCKFYEWKKGLDYNEGIKRINIEYPDGIPLDSCGNFYHLATYHIEDKCIPCYHPKKEHPIFAPMPYPVFISNSCKKEEIYHTRDELNEF